MKPHIKKQGTLWLCGIRGALGVVGVGYDPAGAYRDWWAMARRAWVEGS
jgi:hypothetical protein